MADPLADALLSCLLMSAGGDVHITHTGQRWRVTLRLDGRDVRGTSPELTQALTNAARRLRRQLTPQAPAGDVAPHRIEECT